MRMSSEINYRSLKYGNCTALQKIGEGGFGRVFEGVHDYLKTRVAIKVLKSSEALTAEQKQKFVEEGQIIRQQDHDAIIKVLDCGIESVYGIPYLVMELEGESLYEAYKDEIPSPGITVGYVEQVASALQLLHDKGIVHRDIKTRNILLKRENNSERRNVCISDFGLAKPFVEGVTPSGGYGRYGTADYMAPEQFKGSKPTARSDQYSLAVVVYELLTGQMPFRGSTTAIENFHKNKEPPPSMNCDMLGIPKAMEAVVKKALSKDPSERYESVTAFYEALNAALLVTGQLSILSRLSAFVTAPTVKKPGYQLNPTRRALLMALGLGVAAAGTIEVERLYWHTAALAKARVPARVSLSQLPKSFRYSGHTASVQAIAWSPDGKYIASGDGANLVHVWDAHTKQFLRVYGEHHAPIKTLSWTPNSSLVASLDAAGQHRTWMALSGTLCQQFPMDEKHKAQAFTFFNEKDLAITTGSIVRVYDAYPERGVTLPDPFFTLHTNDVLALAKSPDSRYIASASKDHTVKIWLADQANAPEPYCVYDHHSEVYSVAWAPKEPLLASAASADNTVSIWIVLDDGSIVELARYTHSQTIKQVAWSPNAHYRFRLASCSADGSVAIWSMASNLLWNTASKELKSYQVSQDSVNALCWSPDGRYLALAGNDKQVVVFEP